MRQRVGTWEHLRRGNAATILIVALQMRVARKRSQGWRAAFLADTVPWRRETAGKHAPRQQRSWHARAHDGAHAPAQSCAEPLPCSGDAWRMIQRRAADLGTLVRIGCHTFRATGITAYLEAGGTLENAQAMAAHESPRTTKLYDRTGDAITLDEVERITI
jgi:integrase